MRNLATIQKISAISPIKNADAIETARVLGWNVVVKKGEFSVGDLCVFFEIDSILPDKPWSAFLKDSNGNIKKLKTVKLRGQISQGLAIPLKAIEESGTALPRQIGADVTDLLGVIKFEEDAVIPCGNQKAKFLYPSWMPKWLGKLIARFNWGKRLFFFPQKTWPGFVPKTDETRVQILQPLLDRYSGNNAFVTEKIDGSSCTVYLKKGKFGVCSRNLELNDDGNNYWNTVKRLGIEEKMRLLKKNMAFQGELVGPGIQGNKYKLSEHKIYWFSAWNIDQQKYENVFDYFPESECCPLIGKYVVMSGIDAWVNEAKGNSLINPKTKREGLVIRPTDESGDFIVADTHGMCKADRVSFKVINPEFLLEYGE